MTPARTIIQSAYRKLLAIDPEESISAVMMANGLEALQMYIGSLPSGMIYYTVDSTHVLTGGTASYTIGSGGDIDEVWPRRIMSARVTDSGGLDYDLRPITEDAYNRIPEKATQGTPHSLYYEPAFPLGIIYLYYTPEAASTLKFSSEKQLTEPSKLTSNLNFPRPYDRMLIYNLALELAPETGFPASQEVVGLAIKSMADIEIANAATKVQTVQLSMPGLRGNRHGFDIWR